MEILLIKQTSIISIEVQQCAYIDYCDLTQDLIDLRKPNYCISKITSTLETWIKKILLT